MGSKVIWAAALACVLTAAPSEASTARGKSRYWVEAKHRKVHAERSEIAQVARRAMGAVVSITTRQEGEDPESDEPSKGLGSGFLIHPDGYILTSSHVVEGSNEITVSVLGPRGTTRDYPARVVGMDPQTDCALLKIDAKRKLPVLKLGSSRNVSIADWVVVIGNPFGLAHSVSVGVVSYKGRTDVTPAGRTGYFDYLQTDAAINPGNSGGPILDVTGEVVAIANAVNVAGQGIGFAVPIEMAKDILPQLYGGTVRRGWLGVAVRDLGQDAPVSPGNGVLISSVLPQSPAARAGLQAGDVIRGVNRHRVERAHALRWKIATAGVGKTLALRITRAGRPIQLKVTLQDAPDRETVDVLVPADEPEEAAPSALDLGEARRGPAKPSRP